MKGGAEGGASEEEESRWNISQEFVSDNKDFFQVSKHLSPSFGLSVRLSLFLSHCHFKHHAYEISILFQRRPAASSSIQQHPAAVIGK